MDQLLRIYLDILSNLFSCFLLFRFTEVQIQKKLFFKDKLFFIIIYIIYSIPEQLPFSTLICDLLDILFLIKLIYPHIKKALVIFVKYILFTYLFLTLILFGSLLYFAGRRYPFSISYIPDIQKSDSMFPSPTSFMFSTRTPKR